jgi:hypothetical protein
MNLPVQPIIISGCFLLCGCTAFYSTPSESNPAIQTPKPLVQPVGKNWQILEEPPQLVDERGRLPFQSEQSVQPEGATKPVVPGDNRKIGTQQ